MFLLVYILITIIEFEINSVIIIMKYFIKMGEKDLMDDQKIVINGKEVDISKMSDDELVEFFTELKERELKLTENLTKAEAVVEKYESHE